MPIRPHPHCFQTAIHLDSHRRLTIEWDGDPIDPDDLALVIIGSNGHSSMADMSATDLELVAQAFRDCASAMRARSAAQAGSALSPAKRDDHTPWTLTELEHGCIAVHIGRALVCNLPRTGCETLAAAVDRCIRTGQVHILGNISPFYVSRVSGHISVSSHAGISPGYACFQELMSIDDATRLAAALHAVVSNGGPSGSAVFGHSELPAHLMPGDAL